MCSRRLCIFTGPIQYALTAVLARRARGGRVGDLRLYHGKAVDVTLSLFEIGKMKAENIFLRAARRIYAPENISYLPENAEVRESEFILYF